MYNYETNHEKREIELFWTPSLTQLCGCFICSGNTQAGSRKNSGQKMAVWMLWKGCYSVLSVVSELYQVVLSKMISST